jgi:hypothetical protein
MDHQVYFIILVSIIIDFFNYCSVCHGITTGKAFVREWARLRYGVFEEHGYTGDDASFPMFYKESAGNDLVPNVCSDQQPVLFDFDYGCHVDPQTGLYDSDCTYTLRDEFKPTSSIMSDRKMLKTVSITLYL